MLSAPTISVSRAVVLATVLGALVSAGSCRRATERWNVVLITLDTVRADALGCYGRAGNPTPHLDALARDGTRFDLAITSAAVTPVAHATILTGLDNREHGVRVLSGLGGFRLPTDVPTLATILHDAGWKTIAVHSAFPVSSYYGFERGFDVFDSVDGAILPSMAGTMTWNLPVLQRRSDETTDRALKHLAATDQPFFLWVHYWDPHDHARVPPAEFLGPEIPRDARGNVLPGRELYAAEMRYQDSQIGRLVQSLRDRGEYERTLFVVVADHGEGLGDHGWAAHRILYQEQIRVPLFVRMPNARGVGDVKALVRTSDIAPTVLDGLSLNAPRAMSGRSLRALMEGRADESRTAFADQVNGYDLNAEMVAARPQDDFVYVAIESPWKLVYRPLHPAENELFDLASDPRELTNKHATEPAIVRKLEQALARQGGFVTAPFAPVEGSGVNAAAAQKILSNMGYVASANQRSDVRWAFACPEHRGEVRQEAERCPICSGPMIVIQRPR